ncbi:MAG: hypothetical protein AB1595_01865 [bacterium]
MEGMYRVLSYRLQDASFDRVWASLKGSAVLNFGERNKSKKFKITTAP